MTHHGHRIDNPEQAKAFVFAGKAIFTLVSEATGTRFTYKVKASRDGNVHFVSYLRGPENTSDYSYIGFIRTEGEGAGHMVHGGHKAKAGRDAPVVKAIQWTLANLAGSAPKLPAKLQFWHEGRCGRCGRRLTVPESIATGLGPECAAMTGTKIVKVAPKLTTPAPVESAEQVDRAMAEMEAQADREQTEREEAAKAAWKTRVEADAELRAHASEVGRVRARQAVEANASVSGANSLDSLRKRFSA